MRQLVAAVAFHDSEQSGGIGAMEQCTFENRERPAAAPGVS